MNGKYYVTFDRINNLASYYGFVDDRELYYPKRNENGLTLNDISGDRNSTAIPFNTKTEAQNFVSKFNK